MGRPLTPALSPHSVERGNRGSSPQRGEKGDRDCSPLSPAGGEGTDEGAIRDGAIALDGDHIVAVGPAAELEARFGKAERLDAVILPALVNAHLHLELSHLAGAVTGGGGLPAWIRRFLAARAATRPGDPERAMASAVEALRRAGVTAVGDVTNTLGSLAPFAAAGMVGTLYHEVFGLSRRSIETALAAAEAARSRSTPPPGLRVVPSPHAVYSTHPPTLAALLRAGPASIHLAEDPAERTFCASRSGPFEPMVKMLGGEELPPAPLGRSAVAVVAPHLAPGRLVVHCVDLDDQDVQLLIHHGPTVVLCPRSNRFILGVLPPLPRLLAAGVPLAVGTDSLASSPSLSPLAELAVLASAFREVSARRLLSLAWNGACVGAPAVGSLTPGAAPGIIAAALHGARPVDPSSWLLQFGAEERPFDWIARHRPEVSAA
jgi:aminodeoxyfutalosine deaminase